VGIVTAAVGMVVSSFLLETGENLFHFGCVVNEDLLSLHELGK
jgi:hypothetical protein